jgi:L-seryl-tRNA(Ser) seleniumtransferase
MRRASSTDALLSATHSARDGEIIPDVKLQANQADLLRALPAVDELLKQPEIAVLIEREGHQNVADAARLVLARIRQEVSEGRLDKRALTLAREGMPAAIDRELRQALAPSLRAVINATGVILHTNLGRAPLSAMGVERVAEIASSYSNLEFDLASGERGKRDAHADRLFARLFAQQVGPEAQQLATIVVNNNAAAVLLALNTIAEDGEVVVSRGELVEIGGAFRVPEVMAKAGAVLREVGTTNRTRISDYERAINERTRALLRVHRSNFQMVGFTEEASLTQLVELGRKRNIPVIEDLGSGALFDMRAVGISGEPSVGESLRAGVDLVTYSGDKLLGGPQAGLISGRKGLVARLRSNPLFRALRVDKLTYAALEATLLAYARGDHNAVPALRMMRLSTAQIEQRVRALIEQLRPLRGFHFDTMPGESVIGGGAAPGAVLPTTLIVAGAERFSATELAARLRASEPPVIARVEENKVLLDLRTVFPEQDPLIGDAFRRMAD